MMTDVNGFRPRFASPADEEGIFRLYRETARTPGGIAREENEITREYISSNLEKALSDGVCLVIDDPQNAGRPVAEIHCHRPGPRVFRHVLSNLTIVVHPGFQKRGLGRLLFTALLEHAEKNMPDILRVELVARESNTRAIELYRKIGFVEEGRFEKRIAGVSGRLEADIPMAWLRIKEWTRI